MASGHREAVWAILLALVLLAVQVSGQTATAASGRWADAELADADYAEARLIAAVDGSGQLDTIAAGLQVRMDPPWKTYWRSPGTRDPRRTGRRSETGTRHAACNPDERF